MATDSQPDDADEPDAELPLSVEVEDDLAPAELRCGITLGRPDDGE